MKKYIVLCFDGCLFGQYTFWLFDTIEKANAYKEEQRPKYRHVEVNELKY